MFGKQKGRSVHRFQGALPGFRFVVPSSSSPPTSASLRPPPPTLISTPANTHPLQTKQAAPTAAAAAATRAPARSPSAWPSSTSPRASRRCRRASTRSRPTTWRRRTRLGWGTMTTTSLCSRRMGRKVRLGRGRWRRWWGVLGLLRPWMISWSLAF